VQGRCKGESSSGCRAVAAAGGSETPAGRTHACVVRSPPGLPAKCISAAIATPPAGRGYMAVGEWGGRETSRFKYEAVDIGIVCRMAPGRAARLLHPCGGPCPERYLTFRALEASASCSSALCNHHVGVCRMAAPCSPPQAPLPQSAAMQPPPPAPSEASPLRDGCLRLQLAGIPARGCTESRPDWQWSMPQGSAQRSGGSAAPLTRMECSLTCSQIASVSRCTAAARLPIPCAHRGPRLACI